MLALEGVRILDLAHVAPGAYCTMLLADLGADVIKVEPPAAAKVKILGSSLSPLGKAGRRDAAFHATNRNKRSVALDLKSQEGKEIFLRLAQRTDVILEGFRPGTMKKLGIDYATVSQLNPRIIYCSLSGYGQAGPYSQLPGHDVNYISIGGALDLIGSAGGPPVIPQNIVGDFGGGSLLSAIGILGALLARDKTGRGQYLDMSITDGVLSLLTWQAEKYFRDGRWPRRGASALGAGYPYYNAYRCKDGKYISIGCLEPRFWENLCRALGREDYAPYCFEQSHMTQRPRGGKWGEIKSFLRATFRAKTRDEWFEMLSRADVPVSRVLQFDEVFRDPQVKERRMVIDIEDAELGKIRQVGIPFKMSETPGSVRKLAPVLGEDTGRVLKELGYTGKQIATWRKAGIVG